MVQAIALRAGLGDSDGRASLVTQTASLQTPATGGSISQPADVVALAQQSEGRLSDLASSLARLHQHTAASVDRLFTEFDTRP